jgi:hypothetical protein
MTTRPLSLLVAAVLSAALTSGCSSARDFSPQACPTLTQDALRKLDLIDIAGQLAGPMCPKGLASDADLDEIVIVPDLLELKTHQAGQIGMVLGDLVRSRLSRDCGFKIRQVDLSRSIKIGDGGISLLTRDNKELLSDEVAARRAFVGTYTSLPNTLLLTLREVDLSQGTIFRSVSKQVRFGCRMSPFGSEFSYEIR